MTFLPTSWQFWSQESVGEGVGKEVGDGVDERVGDGVGEEVGENVGGNVGERVGERVFWPFFLGGVPPFPFPFPEFRLKICSRIEESCSRGSGKLVPLTTPKTEYKGRRQIMVTKKQESSFMAIFSKIRSIE
jgi:hypothetical protein